MTDGQGQGQGRGPAWPWLLGLAAWIGATVYAAANLEDPKDPAPVLRTFALGGGAFVAVALGSAASQAAKRRYGRWNAVAALHVLGAAASSALVLTAIGLGETGPWEALLAAGAGLLVVWVVATVVLVRLVE